MLAAAVGSNPFDSCPFVLLYLLERKAEGSGQLLLTHASFNAPQAKAAADVSVDSVGSFGLCHCCSFNRPRLSDYRCDNISVRVQAQGLIVLFCPSDRRCRRTGLDSASHAIGQVRSGRFFASRRVLIW
jgi:hypothetical protein